MKNNDSTVLVTFRFPVSLHKRAKTAAKQRRMTVTALVVMAASDLVEQLEAKQREEEARAQREKEAKKLRRAPSLAPKPFVNSLDKPRDTAPRVDNVYLDEAKKIAKVVHDDDLREHAVSLAIATIKRRAPLTHPGDDAIKQELERVVLRLLDEGEPPEQAPLSMPEVAARLRELRTGGEPPRPQQHAPRRVQDERVGQTLDPARVRTRGDVE